MINEQETSDAIVLQLAENNLNLSQYIEASKLVLTVEPHLKTPESRLRGFEILIYSLVGQGLLREALHNLEQIGDINAFESTYTQIRLNNLFIHTYSDLESDELPKKIDESLEYLEIAEDVSTEWRTTQQLNLLNSRAGYLSKKGRHYEAVDILTKIHQQFVEMIGPKHAHTLTIYNNLGEATASVDPLKACQILEDVVSIRMEEGIQTANLVKAQNNLAVCYQSLGRSEEAISLFQEVLQYRLATLDPTHIHIAETYYNLAYLKSEMSVRPGFDIIGQMKEGIGYLAIGLKILQQTLSEEHPKYIQFLAQMAYMNHILGYHLYVNRCYEEAIQYEHWAYSLYKNLSNDEQTLRCAVNLGNSLRMIQSYEEAIEVLQRELNIYKRYASDEDWMELLEIQELFCRQILQRNPNQVKKILNNMEQSVKNLTSKKSNAFQIIQKLYKELKIQDLKLKKRQKRRRR